MPGYPSNKSQWQPTIPVSQSIYDGTNTTQKAPLGTRLEVGDRVFHYCYATGSEPRGRVCCATSPAASMNGALAACSAATTGATSITFTCGTNVATNQYAEGYMGISKGTQGGAVYRIKSHGSWATGATNAVVTLYDPLYKDLGAADELGFVQNIYDDVGTAATATSFPVCVPMVDVTAGGYFWGQTWGPAAPLNVEATAVGAVVKQGTTGGVVACFGGGTTGPAAAGLPIGKNYDLAGTAGEYTPIFLMIRP